MLAAGAETMRRKGFLRVALALFSVSLGVGGVRISAQETGSGAKGPEYDVVSIRPSSDKSGNMMINGTVDGYRATGTTVKFMIMDAYALKNMDLISGLPKWADDTRYDVETKMSPEMVDAQKKLTPKERDEQRRLMVQALLADRFKLKVHKEEKEMPAYALVQTKSGFKLKPVDSSDPEKTGAKLPNGERGGMLMYGHNSITGQMIPIDMLAQNLGMNLHRQVIDRSGVTGEYDFTLKFTPDDASPDDGSEAKDPSLFVALEEQMGLRLESIKAKIDTVAVDSVAMPSEN